MMSKRRGKRSDSADATNGHRRKPRQKRSAERVDRILDAVDRIVASDGSDALTVAGVTREAGMAAGTIYQYYRNREDLLVAAHDRMLSRLAVELTDSVTRLDILDSQSVDSIIRSFVENARSHPGYMALIKFSYLNKTTQHSEVTAGDLIGHLIGLFVSVWAPNVSASELVITRTIGVNILTIMTNILLIEPDPRLQERYLEEMIHHCKFGLERAVARSSMP